MFTIRPYREEDTESCGRCFYEGFFTCPINENDRIFLRDYAQVLIEKMQLRLCGGSLGSPNRGFYQRQLREKIPFDEDRS